MPALNYRGFPIKSQVAGIITFAVISLLLVLNSNHFVYAGCSDIKDLDDRAACYAEKESEKREDLESVNNEIADILKELEGLSNQATVTQQELIDVETRINDVESRLDIIRENLKNRKETLAAKISLKNTVIREYTKKGALNDMELFLASVVKGEDTLGLTGFRYVSLNYIFDKTVKKEALSWIATLNQEIDAFEQNKQKAEDLKTQLINSRDSLLALQQKLATEKTLAEKEHKDLSAQKQSLEEEIAELSEKQQAILRQKSGEGIITGYEAPEYKLPDPPFKPAFAAMSYGAYTHYKGMSQYGAKGRAEAGKDYKDIIKFYYGKEVVKKDNFPDDLCVEGYGNMDFQKYLYGLAEMPSGWPTDALKAQAIAARSFAYRYEKKGSCICTTQSCQVFLKSKSDNPPSRWKEAVDETKDRIVDGDVVAYYSSTTGGYIENIGWDKDGSWPSGAYEKKAKSPWFYKAWYTETYTDNSGTCGRSTPWLNMEEMTDILNTWVVWKKGSSKDKEHISPVTTSCWGGDPYSHSKMAEKADEYGDKYTNISSVSVDQGNNGSTSTVHFNTNKGTVSIGGEEFKTVFNLRAPAYVALRSRLFDIELEK